MLRHALAAFVLAVLGAFALPLAAQSHDPLFTATKQQLDVAKVVLQQQDAWNAGNLDGYLAHFKNAADTEVVLGGPIRGLEEIHKAFRVTYPSRESMGTLEDSEIEVKALGENFALATGKYHLTRSHKAGGDSTGYFSEVFEKTSAGWQVIFSEAI